MKFEGFCGNLRIREYLSNAVDRGEISNAYMLSGPDGIGKKTLAGILARAIVCQSAGEKPCGTCSACVKSARGSHPDIIHIRGKDANTGVDMIRELKQDAYLRPNDGARKVYLINKAETMTQQAQNALLKILEEPPAFTVFLLLCYNEKSMLETVRSRCVRLNMAPLNPDEMQELLQRKLPDCTPDRLKELSARAGGVAGRVLEDEQDSSDQYARGMLKAAAQGDGLDVMEYMISVEKLKREELIRVLECTMAYLRDGFAIQITGMEPIGTDMRDVLAALFERAGRHGVMRMTRALESVKAYCMQNIGVAHITGFLACEFIQAVRT